MKHIVDAHGKKIPVTTFSNLQEKIDTATGYIMAYNDFAAKQNAPQVSVETAVKKIKKAHAKFYGECSKYNGKGELRE